MRNLSLSKTAKAMIAALPLAFGTVAAHADVVSVSGGVMNLSWSYDTGAGFNLTGTGSITVTRANDTTLYLDITLTNSTALQAGGASYLYSFGFGINPNATGVAFSDPDDTTGINAAILSTQQGSTQIPSVQGIEVCAYGASNCSGGGNPGGGTSNGITNGASDSFRLILSGLWLDNTVTIDPVAVKYQGYPTSYEFQISSSSSSSSSSSTGGPPSSGPVPEPGSGSLALLGLGLLGAGFVLRRKSAA